MEEKFNRDCVENSLDECNLPSEYVDKINHIHKEIQDSIERAITEGDGRITQCELKKVVEEVLDKELTDSETSELRITTELR